MAASGGEGATIEYTPTWIVALVCTVIVSISLLVERGLHYSGEFLLKKKQKPLFQAIQKIKEELMLLGFISLMLAVFQEKITRICIPKSWTHHWLPCNNNTVDKSAKSTSHLEEAFSLLVARNHRSLLAASSSAVGYCDAKGKSPLLSLKAFHDLHIFIFVLAVTHVVSAALTFLFGGLRIKQWRHWEDSIQQMEHNPQEAPNKITRVQGHGSILSRVSGTCRIAQLSWFKSLLKQFHRSVNKSDYTTLRLGFIMKHCPAYSNLKFYKYMTRALEHDSKNVIGISWRHWVFVVISLLLNVHGWHAYFWISFIPLILLIAVGAKLEHIVTTLAEQVAQRHIDIAKPSDDHFWFKRPRFVLLLIHLVLFQNSFEIAIFFWMLVMYGFNSCIMGPIGFIVSRLAIGVFLQFFCSYSTLPLYAIVMQMGSSFNEEFFDERIKALLINWVSKAKAKNKGRKNNSTTSGSSEKLNHDVRVEMAEIEVHHNSLLDSTEPDMSSQK